MQVDDSHLSVRFRHGVHTIYLFVEANAPFSRISMELAALLHDRYPRGLQTCLDPPQTTRIPERPQFIYGVLNKLDDPAQGWKRLDVGTAESYTPSRCGLTHNSVVAFMLLTDEVDAKDVDFKVEWPRDNDDMYDE